MTVVAESRPKRPALIYRGGKFRIAPWVVSHFPQHEIYVEPFGGAASVLLCKAPSPIEYYNDLDDEIVNVFRVLREKPKQLKRLLEATPYARREFFAAYEPATGSLERARRLIVRSFMGNAAKGILENSGFYSLSRNRNYALSFSGYAEVIHKISERFAGVVIENKPAIEVMTLMDSPTTLHYVDPPSVMESRSDKGADYKHEMTEADHVALAECLNGLMGHVIISGYPSELYQRLFKRWKTVETQTICTGAKPRTEKLWIKPAKK